jgi:hypothetical protein
LTIFGPPSIGDAQRDVMNREIAEGCHVRLISTGDQLGNARVASAPWLMQPENYLVVAVYEDRVNFIERGIEYHQSWEWPMKALEHLDDCTGGN